MCDLGRDAQMQEEASVIACLDIHTSALGQPELKDCALEHLSTAVLQPGSPHSITHSIVFAVNGDGFFILKSCSGSMLQPPPAHIPS